MTDLPPDAWDREVKKKERPKGKVAFSRRAPLYRRLRPGIVECTHCREVMSDDESKAHTKICPVMHSEPRR